MCPEEAWSARTPRAESSKPRRSPACTQRDTEPDHLLPAWFPQSGPMPAPPSRPSAGGTFTSSDALGERPPPQLRSTLPGQGTFWRPCTPNSLFPAPDSDQALGGVPGRWSLRPEESGFRLSAKGKLAGRWSFGFGEKEAFIKFLCLPFKVTPGGLCRCGQARFILLKSIN